MIRELPWDTYSYIEFCAVWSDQVTVLVVVTYRILAFEISNYRYDVLNDPMS